MLQAIKNNTRLISDATAGTPDYFELATTNLSLYRALGKAAQENAKGLLLDAGAGRLAYRAMLEAHCSKYESLDLANPTGRVDHVADLQSTGLPSDSYDTVFCSQVLQHLPEPQRAVTEMARILRPGGRLIISVPHLVWMHNEPHDYWRFTVHGMRFMLEKAGLRVVSSEPIGGLLCFLAYAPSTLALALLWPVRPLFKFALLLNKAFIRIMLPLDRAFGLKSLYPTNILVVAEKPR